MLLVIIFVASLFFACIADPNRGNAAQCNDLVDSQVCLASHFRQLAVRSRTCRDCDQNVFIQGSLKLRMSVPPENGLDEGDAQMPTHEDPVPIAEMSTGAKMTGGSRFAGVGPIENLAVQPGEPLENFVASIAALGAPKGWLLLPAMGCLFVLLLQCTEVHADTFSAEDALTSDAQPPPKPDRLSSFDIVRFGLLLAIVWTQLLRLFGSNAVALQAQEFVWPSWFFICGIFGSSFTYESLARTICYCLATNFMLTFSSLLFAFFNYSGGVELHINGAWLLWSQLLFRLTLTPGLYAIESLRIPSAFYFVLVYAVCFYIRSKTVAQSIETLTTAPGPTSLEPLLLFVSSQQATLQTALLHAPYFTLGLLMKPCGWNSLLRNRWAIATFAAGGMLWLMFSGSPLLCQLSHWRCSSSSWGVQIRLHALHLGELREDIELYLARMGCMFLLVCFMFTSAQLVSKCAPGVFKFLSDCGSRVRFSLAILVLWHMCRPCILKPPSIPFERPFWLTDFTMVWPALVLTLMVTSAGVGRLFRWAFEPYWVKYLLEITYKSFAERVAEMKPLS
mmetsp:Transcript_7177/g.11677  ORF Transcript_7177/g.11677 Transcript_7177/m.11677 type:complete len:563 (+) Transcript_7177:87-1775(+)